jgi:hypothetical protein
MYAVEWSQKQRIVINVFKGNQRTSMTKLVLAIVCFIASWTSGNTMPELLSLLAEAPEVEELDEEARKNGISSDDEPDDEDLATEGAATDDKEEDEIFDGLGRSKNPARSPENMPPLPELLDDSFGGVGCDDLEATGCGVVAAELTELCCKEVIGFCEELFSGMIRCTVGEGSG